MKYKILNNNILQKDATKLYRIQALKSFSDVKEGDIGGFVQGENNLSQFGNCWIYDYAEVSGYASVEDDAIVKGCSRVLGYSKVNWKSVVQDYALVHGHSLITDCAQVMGDSLICDNCTIEDNAIVRDAVIQDTSIIGLNGLVQSTKDYLYIRGIGSKNRATTAYKTKDNIMIVCGCFIDTLNEFKSRVHETHGGTDYEKEYNVLIDIIKIHFNI